jgi:hypothetical protein
MRDDLDRILLDAAGAGAELDDLAVLARAAVEHWKSQRPDEDPGDSPGNGSGGDGVGGGDSDGGSGDGGSDGDGGGGGGGGGDDGDGFADRGVWLGHTFGGAARLTGDLSGECAAAVQAVLDALGKKRGPGDARTRSQRFHDSLQEACELLIRAKMVPGRAGADTRVDAVVSLRDLLALPGARAVEDAWLASAAGHHVHLSGRAAEAAACDAMITPVVTGTADWTLIAEIIDLIAGALTGTAHGTANGTSYGTRSGGSGRQGPSGRQDGSEGQDCGSGGGIGSGSAGGECGLPAQPAGLALGPGEWEALLRAAAKLAVRFVSGPGGLASALRRTLLPVPYSSRSVPLDVGFSQTIPEPIRRAVQLRDRRCRWPGGCDRPPAVATSTTSSTKKTAAPPPSPAASCCASTTTTSASTAGAGPSSSTPTAHSQHEDHADRSCPRTDRPTPPEPPDRHRLAEPDDRAA